MKVKVARTAHFNAAHRLNNPNWSVEKNKNVFGKCNNPNFHGHNYSLTVEIIGDIDAGRRLLHIGIVGLQPQCFRWQFVTESCRATGYAKNR